MNLLRNRHFFLLDLILLPAASVLAFALRLDPELYLKHGIHAALLIIISLPVKLIIARVFGLYKRYWTFASTDELLLIATVTGVSTLISAGLLFGLALPLTGIRGFPRSIPFIDALLTLLAFGGPRFAVRTAWQSTQRQRDKALFKEPAKEKRVLIVGAGNAGTMIAREMLANPHLGMIPAGFIDDDRWKSGVLIHGINVLGTRVKIPELVKEHDISEVIIAMPRVSGSVVREILDICNQANVPTRTIPGLYNIIAGQVSVNQIRNVDIEDLLRRDPVRIDTAAVHEMIRGRRVLVTGGGGSIGGELCRQILRASPQQLVLIGHGENSVFNINSELKRDRSIIDPNIVPLVADIKDKQRLDSIFTQYQPELVFHAAAHKHVSLMETNVCEAVINNVQGTRNLIEVSAKYKVDRLVLVSTDKAVNPTSIMGVTKRITELMVRNAASCYGQRCSAVRFGNVLGSRGSVVNIFKRQILEGGPVIVTHPEMRRFFMTIPEAVQLVLQAASLGQGGEVFVLDMGEPVKIVDLASDLIRLSGFRPHLPGDDPEKEWDIEVIYSRPQLGEKMEEQLFSMGEGHIRTQHEKIFVTTTCTQSESDNTSLESSIDLLVQYAHQGNEQAVRRIMKEIVPEYQNGQLG